jgi:hypothetical protein
MLTGAEKPLGPGKSEQIKLDSAATHLLEECRMVLPGIQALFGFQLIAVFNSGFDEKLSSGEQILHFAAMLLVALSAALVMAPAAIHRQANPQAVSERFVWLSSLLLLSGMLPLALGLSLDIYLISRVIFDAVVPSLMFAALLFAVCSVLWLVLPRMERKKLRAS